MILDYLRFSLDSISHRKLRSFLTVLGIIIGVGAIIALITISQGLENAIKEQFSQVGSNRIYVTPKGFSGPGSSVDGLTNKDVDAIRSVSEVDWVNPYLFFSDEVTFGHESEFIQQVIAFPSEDVAKKYADTGRIIEFGRVFVNNEKGVALVGARFAKSKYNREVGVNSNIIIKNEKFRVVGILEEVGNPDDDNMVVIAEEDARILYDKPSAIDMIEVKVKDGVDIRIAGDKIKNRLEKIRDNDNFEVITPEQILEQLGSLLGVVQLILGGIAAISLVVGAIGISNSMYTSVLERTKEIGILKSVGARNSDILFLFIIESGIIGLLGGMGGAILGSLAAVVTGVIAESQGFGLLKIVIDWKLIVFSLFFAMVIGMFAGALPSGQAAKLKPADSLRY